MKRLGNQPDSTSNRRRRTDAGGARPLRFWALPGPALAVLLLVVATLLGAFAVARAQPADDAIRGLTLTSDASGTLTVSWSPVRPRPTDHRINYGPEDESFPSWRDDEGNASSVTNSHTISGLEPGAYKLRLRARYHSGHSIQDFRSGPWSETVTITITVTDPVGRPAPPTGLDAVQIAADQVTPPVVAECSPTGDEFPEDTSTTGRLINRRAEGRISQSCEVDYFRLELSPGDWLVRVDGAELLDVFNGLGRRLSCQLGVTQLAQIDVYALAQRLGSGQPPAQALPRGSNRCDREATDQTASEVHIDLRYADNYFIAVTHHPSQPPPAGGVAYRIAAWPYRPTNSPTQRSLRDGHSSYAFTPFSLATPDALWQVESSDLPELAHGKAGTLAGSFARAAISNAADKDWINLGRLTADRLYYIHVRGADSGNGSLVDPVLVGFYDADGIAIPYLTENVLGPLGDDDSGVGRDSLELFIPSRSGVYYAVVAGKAEGTGSYAVAVEDVTDVSTSEFSDIDFYFSLSGEIELAGRLVPGQPAAGTAKSSDYDSFRPKLVTGRNYRVQVAMAGNAPAHVLHPFPVLTAMFEQRTNNDLEYARKLLSESISQGEYSRRSLEFKAAADLFIDGQVRPSAVWHVVAISNNDEPVRYSILLTDITDTESESELGDVATSGRVMVGGSITGTLSSAADVDWFGFATQQGKQYRIKVRGADSGWRHACRSIPGHHLSPCHCRLCAALRDRRPESD